MRTLLSGGADVAVDTSNLSDDMMAGWAPFNGPDGQVRCARAAHCQRTPESRQANSCPSGPPARRRPQSLLGEVDLSFLAAYALGMFFAGHLGDRLDLRWFLSAGQCATHSGQHAKLRAETRGRAGVSCCRRCC